MSHRLSGTAPPEMKTPAAARRQGFFEGADIEAGKTDDNKTTAPAQERARRAHPEGELSPEERRRAAKYIGQALAKTDSGSRGRNSLLGDLTALGVSIDACRPGRRYRPTPSGRRLILIEAHNGDEYFGPGQFAARALPAALLESIAVAIAIKRRPRIYGLICGIAALGNVATIIEVGSEHAADWAQVVRTHAPCAISYFEHEDDR